MRFGSGPLRPGGRLKLPVTLLRPFLSRGFFCVCVVRGSACPPRIEILSISLSEAENPSGKCVKLHTRPSSRDGFIVSENLPSVGGTSFVLRPGQHNVCTWRNRRRSHEWTAWVRTTWAWGESHDQPEGVKLLNFLFSNARSREDNSSALQSSNPPTRSRCPLLSWWSTWVKIPSTFHREKFHLFPH